MKTLREFESLYSFNMTHDGIFEYSIHDILDYLDCYEMDYEEESDVLMEFLDSNNITYYSAPRESFWIQDGFEKCRKEGNTKVVMEDLS